MLAGPVASQPHRSGLLPDRAGYRSGSARHRTAFCPRHGDRPLVLVCGHAAGKTLFGAERCLIDTLRGLAKARIDAVVTLPGPPTPDYLAALRPFALEIAVFEYGWWRPEALPDHTAVTRFVELAVEHQAKAIYANTAMLRAPLLAAERLGLPGVVHAHEILSADAALAAHIAPDPETAVARVLELASHVIANSRATAAVFAGPKPVYRVPNTAAFDSLDLDHRPSDSPGDPTVRIALISSNIAKKGLSDFTTIAERLSETCPNARCVLIGPRSDLTEGLQALQAEGAVAETLVFAGYRETPAQAMAEADIVVNLSHFAESFGRTVLEAMVARRPVVAYAHGALPELVTDGETGFLVPYRDVEAAAARLEQLCVDPALRQRLGEAGRRHALERHAPAVHDAALEEAFQHVLDTPPSPKPVVLAASGLAKARPADARLRLGFVVRQYPMPGLSRLDGDLAALVARGHDVRVFCRLAPLPDTPVPAGVTWEAVNGPDALALALKRSRREIVHGVFGARATGAMAARGARRAGLDYTLEIAETEVLAPDPEADPALSTLVDHPRCLGVFADTPSVRAELVALGVAETRIVVNPGGFEHGFLASPTQPGSALRRITAFALRVQNSLIQALDKAAAAAGMILHVHRPPSDAAVLAEILTKTDVLICLPRPGGRTPAAADPIALQAMAAGVTVVDTAEATPIADGIDGLKAKPTPRGFSAALARLGALPRGHLDALAEAARATAQRHDRARALDVMLRVWRRRALEIAIAGPAKTALATATKLERTASLPLHIALGVADPAPEDVLALSRAHAERPNLSIALSRATADPMAQAQALAQAHPRLTLPASNGLLAPPGWDRAALEDPQSALLPLNRSRDAVLRGSLRRAALADPVPQSEQAFAKRVLMGTGAACPLCGFAGARFADDGTCPNCGATPAERTLAQVLVGLTGRRRAYGSGIGPAIRPLWEERFGGLCLDPEAWLADPAQAMAAGRAGLAVLCTHITSDPRAEVVIAEAAHRLTPDATLILRVEDAPTAARMQALAAAQGFGRIEPHRATSEAIGGDWRLLLLCQRRAPAPPNVRTKDTTARLVIHAGWAKTATTAIQAALGANAPSLAKRGVRLTDAEGALMPPGEAPGAALPMIEALRTGEPLREGALGERLLRAAAPLKAEETLVLSAENLSEPECADLLSGLDRAARLSVVFFLRPHHAWLPSAWKQWAMKEGATLEEFVATSIATAYPGYRRSLDAYAGVLPEARLIVRLMHPAAMADPVAAFAEAAQIGTLDARPSLTNPSMDAALIEAMARHPELFADRHDNRLFRALERRLPPEYLRLNAPLLDADLAQRIEAGYRAEMQDILARYCSEDGDLATLYRRVCHAAPEETAPFEPSASLRRALAILADHAADDSALDSAVAALFASLLAGS
ncbi:MAG: glycosyltransferase family 4 protein [Pseudomonadota bacterium]